MEDKKIRKFTDTIENEDGTLTAMNAPDGGDDVKTVQFAETVEDENGNLIAKGRGGYPKEDHADAHVVGQYADTVEDENGNLKAVPYSAGKTEE